MKTFKYEIDLARMGLNDEAKAQVQASGQKTIFENMCNQAIQARYKDGIGGATQRSYFRILNSLDTAKNGTVELEDADLDFLKEIFGAENTRFHPTQTRLVGAYLESIDQASGAKDS